MKVIYEDNHIIAVHKTCREIVQGDKTGDTPLSDILKTWLKEKYNKPGNVFVGVAHRLDRPVSGVVVFAKTSKALSRLNDMFRVGSVKKTYWAIVKNCPPAEEGELVVATIMVDEGATIKRLRPAPQGRAYRVRKRSNHVTLTLETINK